jgi:hypothetical protein
VSHQVHWGTPCHAKTRVSKCAPRGGIEPRKCRKRACWISRRKDGKNREKGEEPGDCQHDTLQPRGMEMHHKETRPVEPVCATSVLGIKDWLNIRRCADRSAVGWRKGLHREERTDPQGCRTGSVAEAETRYDFTICTSSSSSNRGILQIDRQTEDESINKCSVWVLPCSGGRIQNSRNLNCRLRELGNFSVFGI